MTHLTTSLLTAAAVAATASLASAQVLINDDFNRTVTGDFGATPGGIDYSSPQTSGSVDGSMGVFGASVQNLEADLAPLAPNGYTVSYTAQRATGGGFVSFFTGVNSLDSDATVFDIENADADYGVLVQQDNDNPGQGRAVVFVGGTAIDTYSASIADNQAPIDVAFTVTAPDGYDDGDTGTLALSVNGAFLGTTDLVFDGNNSGFASLASNQAGSSSRPSTDTTSSRRMAWTCRRGAAAQRPR